MEEVRHVGSSDLAAYVRLFFIVDGLTDNRLDIERSGLLSEPFYDEYDIICSYEQSPSHPFVKNRDSIINRSKVYMRVEDYIAWDTW